VADVRIVPSKQLVAGSILPGAPLEPTSAHVPPLRQTSRPLIEQIGHRSLTELTSSEERRTLAAVG
jgi:hypothetical protein